MDADAIVIGAGIAGLIYARRLSDRGVTFYHGSDPALLDALRNIPGIEPIEGWSRRIEGSGRPCRLSMRSTAVSV